MSSVKTSLRNQRLVFICIIIVLSAGIVYIYYNLSFIKNPVIIPDKTQDVFTTNNLKITNMTVRSSITPEKYRMVTFDIKWDYSWRSAINWDAAWVFVKFRVGDGDWKHATLSIVPSEHNFPSGSTIDAPPDGKGVFIYRSENGTGTFEAEGVSLKWNYGLDNVPDDAAVNIKIFGIEMVYIPEGSFYAGDDGYSLASFKKGSNDKRSWFITSEDAIQVTNTTKNGYYYTSSKDYWNEKWNESENITGTSFTIPADFPKGFRDIYCMKYEISQQQYVDFLNTLNKIQAVNNYDRANYNKYGYTISQSNGVYSTAHPNRACGFISPSDGLAYADWSGLRPMTELEFEKICRGSGNPSINGEFAWGTTFGKNAKSVNGSESDRETIKINGSNCYYWEDNYQPQFPLNTGIFASFNKSRELSGSTYYGVLEMSGNLDEACISVGTKYGRAFTYRNGDGQLAVDGSSNEKYWPQSDGVGFGYRGGNFAREKYFMQVSNREDATVAIDKNHRHIPLGFRGVRTASAATAGSQVINAETVARLKRVADFDLPDSFVNTIVFSPDSRTMITGDRNGEVLIWECETWEKTPYLPARSNHDADTAAQIWYWGTLALSLDGEVIVTAYGNDGKVTGRDRACQEVFAFSYGARVYSVAISPNGKFLAVGGLKSSIVIFDLGAKKPVVNLSSDNESIMALVFSPDGNMLLAYYRQPKPIFTIWDTATWQKIETFSLAAEPVEYLDYHDVLFSPDGKELVVASTENVEIKVWDLATKQIVRKFPEHTWASYQITFSPDGSLLASVGDDSTLRLWDMKSGVNVKTIRVGQEAGAVAFSPDSTLIAVSVWGEGVQVWAVTP